MTQPFKPSLSPLRYSATAGGKKIPEEGEADGPRRRRRLPGGGETLLSDDPTPPAEDQQLWYKDAIIYEVHVRAFFDSNGDGMGDFRGLTREARLSAGPRRHGGLAPAVLPVPLARRRVRHRRLPDVHPAYGTLRDFQVS